ncbi:unnamed protein product [Ixodes pacificus]
MAQELLEKIAGMRVARQNLLFSFLENEPAVEPRGKQAAIKGQLQRKKSNSSEARWARSGEIEMSREKGSHVCARGLARLASG